MFPFRRFCLASLCFAALGALPLPAQTAHNRILAPIDETRLVALRGNTPAFAQPRFDQGPAPLSLPTGRIALILERSPAQQQALTQFLDDVQNPASSQYHRWLTPAQYGALYGPSDADLQTVEAWLQSHGFHVERLPQARNFIQFSGNIEQLETAFHTSIHTFATGNATHFANLTDPEIPAALAPVVAGLTPLNDSHPHPNVHPGITAHYDPFTRSIQPDLTLFNRSSNGTYLFLDPADAATIYDSPNAALNPSYKGATMDGTGASIGILGVSDLTLSDIRNYRVAFLGETTASANLPTVVVDGDDPGLVPGGAADEALLDNEIAGALAPQAKLTFYTSADTSLASGLMNAYLRALNDNAVGILNISFSGCEADEGSGGNQALLEAAQQAAAQGITVTVSSGDGGSAGCDDFDTATQAQRGLAVNGIASTPYTVAVGGTDFGALASAFSTYVNSAANGTAPYYRTALGYIPELPWNESTSVNATLANNVAERNGAGQTSIVAAGGGPSTCAAQSSTGACLAGYAKPAFQTSLTPNDHVRDLPDVSLFASNGFYGAFWVFCSDNATDGNSGNAYTECQTTGGQITGSTSFGGVGGTSAAAPAFAGMLALVSQSQGGARLGQADTILYRLAQSRPFVFHDVDAGNNSVPCATGSPNCGANGFLTGYNAGAGYDLASGLGSVDVAALIGSWGSVALNPTSTSLTIDGSAAAYNGTHGAAVPFNTAVAPTSGSGTPTGTVAITATAGSEVDGQFTITLNNGSGSATWNGLPGGSWTVSARYAGDTSNAASTSGPISVTIAPETSATTLAAAAANPLSGAPIASLAAIPYGSQLVFNAQIAGAAEASKTQGNATGTVTYTDGAATLGTASIDSQNTASWPPLSSAFTVLSTGSHTVTAHYSGDASFDPSASAPATLTIVKAATSIAATDTTATVTSATSSTITVTVQTPVGLGATPTGAVTLSANNSTVATISLASTLQGSGSSALWVLTGTGSVSGAQLASGNNNVTIAYSGDANYAASSTAIALDNTTGGGADTPPTPAIALTNSGNLTLHAGAGSTATITLTPTGGFTGPVALTCAITSSPTGATAPPTCSIPSPLAIAGTAAATASLTIATTSATTSALDPPKFFLAGGGAAFALVLFFGIPARRRAGRALLSLLAILVAVSAIGCGGSSGAAPIQSTNQSTPGTTPGAYSVTVTAADTATGKITAATTLTVTVD
ncbi:MAG TPA: protease pro-enzyme activation domain-containing protein [Acidobacteriaceae bacterium]|jgi:subtilase family serine protease|nr:protease pro-enzyme activation domain-containing protein [Acidobacteriaceae bacterium]